MQAAGLKESWYQLTGRRTGILPPMLTTQYRMNLSIAAFPNRAFYNGKLLTDSSTADRPPIWYVRSFRWSAASMVRSFHFPTPIACFSVRCDNVLAKVLRQGSAAEVLFRTESLFIDTSHLQFHESHGDHESRACYGEVKLIERVCWLLLDLSCCWTFQFNNE